MPQTKLHEGDILIRRVHNGWVVLDWTEGTEAPLEIVFEDGDSVKEYPVNEAMSLEALFYEMFSPYFQSKYRGGLTVEVKDKGREADDEF